MDRIDEKIKAVGRISEIIPHVANGKIFSIGNKRKRLNPCPFCEANDAFTIYHDDKSFKCFACENKGSVIDFIIKVKKLSTKGAMAWLCEYYNIKFKASQDTGEQRFSQAIKQEIWRKATEYYHKQMFTKEAKPVLDYLVTKRGISVDTIKYTKLGFTNKTLLKHLTKNEKYTIDILKETGLVAYKEGKDGREGYWTDYFAYGGILFPHFNLEQIMSFSFKFNIDKKGKFIYKVKQPKGNTFSGYPLKNQFKHTDWVGYGMDSLLQESKDPVVLVEGEFEYLAIIEKCKYKKVFCICGNQTGDKTIKKLKTSHQPYLMAFDHDKPGDKYTDTFGEALLESGNQVAILPYPEDFNDPDEWLAASPNPTKEFHTLLENPERYISLGENGVPDPITGIYKHRGAYHYNYKDKNGNDAHKKISNFLIEFPVQYIEDHDGEEVVEREFILTNQKGEKTKPTRIEADDLCTVKNFTRWLLKRGNFEMTQLDNTILENLRQFIHNKEPRRTVRIEKQIGYLEDENIFLLGNGIVTGNKKFIPAEMNGITWLYPTKGYKPYEQDAHQQLPNIELGMERKEYEDMMSVFISYLTENVGTAAVALVVGWFKAALFSDIIYKEFHKFPLMFIYGATRSGKNFLIEEILGKLYGYEKMPSASMVSSTIPQMFKKLHFWSNLIVWYDEHSLNTSANKKDVEKYYAPLKSIYQKTGRSIAVDSSIRTRSDLVRGSVLLSGENLPSEPSVRNRCIILELNAKNRNDEVYPYIQEMADKLPYTLYHWLCDRMDADYVKNIIAKIKSLLYRFKRKGITGREAENYSIVGAFAQEFYQLSDKNVQEDFLTFLEEETKHKFTRMESESIINIFTNDLDIMLTAKKGYVTKDYFLAPPDEPDRLYVWGKGVHSAWLSYRKKDQNDYNINVTYNEWKDLLREQSYYLPENETKKAPLKYYADIGRKRSIVLNRAKLPEEYKTIFESNPDSPGF
ncbi:MAG: CHC2 zinc finger domain-containing protein [Bacteroidota bacterium]